jgi:hypothetical protein
MTARIAKAVGVATWSLLNAVEITIIAIITFSAIN